MKITIDVSQEVYGSIERLAKYCGASEARIVEAIAGCDYNASWLDAEGDANWLTFVDHIRATDGDNERLRAIDRFIAAMRKYNGLHSFDAREKYNSGQMNSLAAFEAWEQGKLVRSN